MTVTPAAAEKFCELCDWTHTVWSIHKAFESDTRTETLGRAGYGHLFLNLSTMSMEYTLLQIAKLHDPAHQGGRANLTIDFMVEECEWDATTKATLRGLSAELQGLFDRIRLARHKVIAHNDLATILANKPTGGFPIGLDHAYFKHLEAFAAAISARADGVPFTFTDHAATDVLVLLNALSESDREAL